MNYLAHILLSGDNSQVILGNFIGDFVKGNSFKDYELDIQRGVLLHRFIDDFTDNHPKVKSDIKLISNHIGRYAPVAVDVFYDYLLAKHWNQFSSLDIDLFCDNFYSMASKNTSMMPEKCRFMFRYMKRDNWLGNYQNKKGVEKTLIGISRRTKFNSGLENAITHLDSHEEIINSNFVEFYEELNEKSKLFLDGKA